MRYSRDFEDFGESIRRTVQRACDSGNFSSLNRTITDTVNGAMDAVFGPGERREPDIRDVHPEPFASGRPGEDEGRMEDFGYENSVPYERKYAGTSGKKILGAALAACGYAIGGILLAGALIVTFSMPLIGTGVTTAAAGTLGVVAVPFFAAGIYGSRLLGRVNRFKGYLSVLKDQDFGNISDFAERVRKPEKRVLKDIDYMLEKRWFLQGHMDDAGTCLMTSDRAYREYQALMRRNEEMKAQQASSEASDKAENGRSADMDPDIRETLEKGNEFIKKIRECNDAIPGEEVSGKIFRMEVLVRKIFKRVEEEPDTAKDIRRLMEYYLPTAVKLLEAYEDLDSQPVQGENIAASKREIEETMDTLNSAFEKLLDNLFQDTAWDVSSDVSVLKTMLAQEGLTEKDFEAGNTGGR